MVDLESPAKPFSIAGGKVVGLGVPPNIQPFQALGDPSKSRRSKSVLEGDAAQRAVAAAICIWLFGVFFGYDWMWPLELLLDMLYAILSIPPFSWLFGWITGPINWALSWFYRGAPLVSQVGALQELRLPTDQVSVYADSYVQQYGDAALIFASHDGYPQIVNSLLYNRELGYHDLVDAADENGNTALIYAASKGYRQTTGALLRAGADPDLANQGGGGRTALMEAAGSGHKDIVVAIRAANATVDIVDDFGNTALHYAAYHGHLQVVHELLKSNPRKDMQNSYGHTAASYAASNKHKAIMDVLNRVPMRKDKDRLAQGKESPMPVIGDDIKDLNDDFGDVEAAKKIHKEDKYVKGRAEDLHKGDRSDFAPKTELATGGGGGMTATVLTDSERRSLEEQIARLKHANDEVELKAQRRIVELLEKNAGHQKELDEAVREARALRLNQTDLQLKVSDLESRYRSSELRASEEKERADRLNEERMSLSSELERHRSRVSDVEHERDLHMEAAKRHEEAIRRKQQEVAEQLERMEQHARDMSALREELRRKEELILRLQGKSGPSAPTDSPRAPASKPPSDDSLAARSVAGGRGASQQADPLVAVAALDMAPAPTQSSAPSDDAAPATNVGGTVGGASAPSGDVAAATPS